MQVLYFVRVIAALVVGVSASPAKPSRRSHVLHEQRAHVPHGWTKRSRVREDTFIPVRIGLSQNNLHRAEEFINDVSHPESPNYGRHWTPQQVADMFEPSLATVNVVKSWLHDYGIDPTTIKMSNSRGWLSFNASMKVVEDLLEAEYHTYSHKEGHEHVACHKYSLPAHVTQHVDIITPTIHFDQKIGSGRKHVYHPLPEGGLQELKRRQEPHLSGRQEEKAAAELPTSSTHGVLGTAADPSNPKEGPQISSALIDLDSCDSMITPTCLRALYNLPPNTKANGTNSIGISEFTPQAFLQEDLDMWFNEFSPQQKGTSPQVQLIDGAIVQRIEQNFNLNSESALDLQFAMALVYPQQATLYQVGDLTTGGSFNNFLDALDASYCDFEGGGSKDAGIDGQYPDNQPGGFTGPLACGTVKPTNVISTSYASNEADLSTKYVVRQCAEYMKLGLQGVSVLFSSGDFGVGGNGGNCISPTTGAYVNGSSGIFNPSFPGTCPYVTAVGATQVAKGSTVRTPEMAAMTAIFSGGGFSNVFAIPSWQQESVRDYFNSTPPPYGADRFNNSQATRGYPDISANGVNYVVTVNGNFTRIFGTSASCPVVASMITQVNEERLAAGKSVVGFINPALYANPGAFNDISTGSNPGCGTKGFEAAQGWDPVTGMGTPNYPAMLKMFMDLP